MTQPHKNCLLTAAIVIAVLSLPFPWLDASDAQVTLPSCFPEVFGPTLSGMSFEITGLQGALTLDSQFSLFTEVIVAVLACCSQLLNHRKSFDIPELFLWSLAIAGVALVSLPVLSRITDPPTVAPRTGWSIALVAAMVPLAVLSLPDRRNSTTVGKATSETGL